MGCILPTMKQNAVVEGRIQAEKVLWIGLTSIEDGERLMIVRGPDYNMDKWVPMQPGSVVFDGRCVENRGGLDGV